MGVATGGSAVQAPIFVVGSPRSGTGMMRTVLRMHPGIAMRPREETFLWRRGLPEDVGDRLTPEQATPKLISYIRKSYAKYQRQAQPGQRIGDKTTGHALRVGFVASMFPDSQFLHIIRDGRAAAVSARREWQADVRPRVRRAVDAPLMTVIKGAWKYFGRRVKRAFTGRRRVGLWGPRFRGVQKAVKERPLIEVCGMLWRECVETAHKEGTALGPKRYMEFHYEDFCRNPRNVLGEILDFLDLPPDEKINQWLDERISTTRNQAWVDHISPEELEALMREIGPTMKKFGYPAEAEATP